MVVLYADNVLKHTVGVRVELSVGEKGKPLCASLLALFSSSSMP